MLAVAGLGAGWLLLAVEALAQGGAGILAGFPWQSVSLTPPFGLPLVHQDLVGEHTAWAWTVCLLAGPIAMLAVGAAAHTAAEVVGAPAWVRAVAFESFAIAWLRLPVLLFAAGVPGGQGPLATLYERLGEPESGRWATFALGLVVLWGVAALVAWRAVAFGREWLRVDGHGFRRRVVRIVAGYPTVLATAAYAVHRPLAPAGWLAAGLAIVVGMLVVRTK